MEYDRKPTPLWNPYAAGIALGLVLFFSLFLTGSGLGGSGGLARVMALGVDQLVPQVTNRNAYLVGMAGGTRNPLDHRMVWMLLGVLAGGAVSGWFAGRFRVETCRPSHVRRELRWLLALTGGALMGWGAAMARGCTSGQALSGGAVLAAGSWAFMMMVFAGAYLLAYPLRRLWN